MNGQVRTPGCNFIQANKFRLPLTEASFVVREYLVSESFGVHALALKKGNSQTSSSWTVFYQLFIFVCDMHSLILR